MSNTTNLNQRLPLLKKILVIGSGGRENALAWALNQSKGVEEIFISPGNGGSENLPGCTRINFLESTQEEIAKEALSRKIDLVVIGPEADLANGLADTLRKHGLVVFGPGADGALIEASKDWAKSLMKESKIPTAQHWIATNQKEALTILNQSKKPLVIKADGLAAGKGVTVSKTYQEAELAIKEAFKGKFGEAGNKLLLEECIEGPEVSLFALCDGKNYVLLPTAQDHKRLLEGDKGPNTGGMGAYAPAPLLNPEDIKQIEKEIIQPTINGLNERGINYRGVIYAGLMITSSGPKVIEFNCRFGDPECQTLMPLLGEEFAQVLQACALGRLKSAPNLSIKKGCSACVIAAASGYPDSPRKGDKITIEHISNEPIFIFHSGSQLTDTGHLVTSGGRVLSIVGLGDNFNKAFNLAYQGVRKIEFKGIKYRKDIGHQVRNLLKSKRF